MDKQMVGAQCFINTISSCFYRQIKITAKNKCFTVQYSLTKMDKTKILMTNGSLMKVDLH